MQIHLHGLVHLYWTLVYSVLIQTHSFPFGLDVELFLFAARTNDGRLQCFFNPWNFVKHGAGQQTDRSWDFYVSFSWNLYTLAFWSMDIFDYDRLWISSSISLACVCLHVLDKDQFCTYRDTLPRILSVFFCWRLTIKSTFEQLLLPWDWWWNPGCVQFLAVVLNFSMMQIVVNIKPKIQYFLNLCLLSLPLVSI